MGSGRLVRTLLETSSGAAGVRSLAWSSDGSRLACGWDTGSVTVCDMVTGAITDALQGHEKREVLVAWFSHGLQVYTCDRDPCSATCRLWDVNTGDLLHELEGVCRPHCRASWSPDGSLVAAGSWDAIVRV